MKRKKLYRPEVDKTNKIIGNRLRKVRKLQNISTRMLGKVLDVSGQQILHYETGVQSIRAADLAVIAKILNRPVSYFFLRGRVMKALSIQQPWAWLIVNGYKDIENRNWITKGRGKVLIHAGKKLDKDSLETLKKNYPGMPWPGNFELGGIVGEARIVDCVTASCSEWFVGKYGFVIKDAKPLPFREYKGQLGFFEVQDM